MVVCPVGMKLFNRADCFFFLLFFSQYALKWYTAAWMFFGAAVSAWLHNVHMMGLTWIGGHSVIKFLSASELASPLTHL